MSSTLQFSSSDVTSPSVVQGLMGLSVVLLFLYNCFPVLHNLGIGICWVGVDLWLVVLAYSLTDILLDAEKKTAVYAQIALNYLYRFGIPYFVLLIVFFFVFPVFFKYKWIFSYLAYYDHQIWYWLGVSNWLIALHSHWLSVQKPLLDHTWLVSLFIQFTIMESILTWFFSRRQLVGICVTLFFASILVRNVLVTIGLHSAVSYVFTFGRWDALGLGSLVALLSKQESGQEILSKWSPIVLFGSLAVITSILFVTKGDFNVHHPLFVRAGYTAFALLFSSVLVYVLTENTFWHKCIKSKFFTTWGKYSVGIYVYHCFLYLLLADLIKGKLNSYFSQPLVEELAISMISKFIIMGVAVVSWHAIERFFVKEIRLEDRV